MSLAWVEAGHIVHQPHRVDDGAVAAVIGGQLLLRHLVQRLLIHLGFPGGARAPPQGATILAQARHHHRLDFLFIVHHSLPRSLLLLLKTN
jgi:hypothetical protein